ncbi:MAG: calcium-translocating P-type ATPase, PMCA-type [Nitrospirae bacterium]|nr:calcium-translocating P-type ATPase, PMCA-type [Nitrospirota bacterium]
MYDQWHLLISEAVLERLRTSKAGLTSTEAREGLAKYGPNQLKEAKKKSPLLLFLKQFADILVIILIAAAIISALTGDVTDTAVIIVIVFLNATIGFTQEYRAERAMAALKKLESPFVVVIRDGAHTKIPAHEIVIGDIVELSAGDRIPADLRLIEVHNLNLEEAALTGESMPVEKITEQLAGDVGLADKRNMAFMGTIITYGRAVGVVTATGMDTELGKIAHLIQEAEDKKTPIQERLHSMGKWLALIAFLLCGVVFAAGILRGEPMQLMFLTAISLAVAAIPESLPAVITIVLALGAYRMVKVKALIRKLPSVETLGSVTTICSDKTGTLTLNRMSAEFIYTIDGLEKEWNIDDKITGKLLRAMALCNDANIEADKRTGDPMELALLQAGIHTGITKEDALRDYPRVNELPFDSSRKRMSTIHKTPDGKYIAFVKGAVDSLLEISPYILTDSGVKEMGNADKGQILIYNEEMASKGVRVLGFAYREDKKEIQPDKSENDLVFIGLVGLKDPPRDEARDAVFQCRDAGIRPVMITGDHPTTAIAIARDVGILSANDRSITGKELADISDEEFKSVVESISVFARVQPEDKVRIVNALRERGHIVAMTGDGVNDAPALKGANIGIAMGITGTDVSKEASDMILLDDNFATIVSAVKEGRIIYDNIRKFIRYMLSTNSGEVLTMFFAIFFGMPLPLLPIQILWVNLVTDSLPALALGLEPAERNVMKRLPRDPKESIFARGMWQHIIWVGLLMASGVLFIMGYELRNSDVRHMQSMAFFTLSMFQMFHVMAIRSERESLFTIGLFSNVKLFGAVLLTFILQLLITYLPHLQEIFKTTSLSPAELFLCLAVSFTVFIAVEAEKAILKQREGR